MASSLKILIPTDYSPNAKRATEFGLTIARKIGVEVILFHSYHVPMSTLEDMTVIEKCKEDEEDRMDKEVDLLKKYYTDLTIRGLVKYGSAVDNLEDIVDKNEIGLIVMGTQGETSSLERFIGSVATHVINDINVTTLVIPEEVRDFDISEVLVATDLKHDPDPKKMDMLNLLLEAYDPAIDIVNIQKNMNNSSLTKGKETIIRSYFKAYRSSFHIIENENVEDGLFDFAADNSCNLIVTMTRHYNLIERIFHRSLTRQLALHTTLPLLVLHYD